MTLTMTLQKRYFDILRSIRLFFTKRSRAPLKIKIPQLLPPIFRLPDILILKIYASLPIIDEACLSLTCTRFNRIFDPTQDETFNFPRLLKLKNPRLCVNKIDVPRNRLLLRLETPTWLYCGVCLKLHPRKAFLNPDVRSIQRRCRENAGIVDLCPCISLTPADRIRVIGLLTKTNLSDITLNGRFEFNGKRGKVLLIHRCCEKAKYWSTKVQLSLFIENGRLLTQAVYTLDSLGDWRVNWGAEPVFGCPHTDLTLLAGYWEGEKKCAHCETTIQGTSSRNSNPATIEVTRILGEIKGPESASWLRQSRFTNESYDQYRIFW